MTFTNDDVCTCGCIASMHLVDESPELSGLCSKCSECEGYCAMPDPDDLYLPYLDDMYEEVSPFEEHLDA